MARDASRLEPRAQTTKRSFVVWPLLTSAPSPQSLPVPSYTVRCLCVVRMAVRGGGGAFGFFFVVLVSLVAQFISRT